MTGRWTDEDGDILMHIARRILNATVMALGLDPNDHVGPLWPERAYRPSQAWFANLNL